MSSTSNTSTFDRVHGIIEKLESAALEKLEMEKHREFVALIESDRHLLVGAKALATYVEQRFTKAHGLAAFGRVIHSGIGKEGNPS